MKLIIIIMFLIPVVVARHNHRTVLESILKSKDNFYAKVDSDVQNVLNNLFDNLDLAPTFLTRSRIKLLLAMHYDLINMAEKNYDVFEKIREAVQPDTGNKDSKGLALFKLIEKTLDDKPFNVSLKLDEEEISHEFTIPENTIVQRAETLPSTLATSLENTSQSDPVFADSKELMKFIKDFIKKVDKLDETDFSKSTPLLPPIEEDTTVPDLEVWEPPAQDFNDSYTRRIFKGKRSTGKSYPFVVSIHFMQMFVCAGSIVSTDLILTAASCLQILHNNRFFRENPRSVQVRIGSDYFSRGGELVQVLESFFHPMYDPKTLANNLVLLRLVRHIRFYKNEKRVKKIKYDRHRSNLPANTEGIIVIGWGSRKRNNIIDQFERLMVAKLDIYHVEECAAVYSKEFVTNRHFCAGFISSGGGACNKDLGGPGVVGGFLAGVISFGAPICGAIDAPTVFTKVGYFAKWIDSIIRQNGPPLAVRTTLRFNTDKHYFLDTTSRPRKTTPFQFKTTRGTVEPPLMFTEETEEYEPDVRRRLQRTSHLYTTTTKKYLWSKESLKNIMYGDYGLEEEDFHNMFKTTPTSILRHPLIHLSLVPIPGIHYDENVTQKYKRIGLTTSSTWRPAPLDFLINASSAWTQVV